MSKLLSILLLIILLIDNVNCYSCDCSCCIGCGCSLVYQGTISVLTCASTTCTDACKSKYSTCLLGSSSAVCSARSFFQFYSILFLIISTNIFSVISQQLN
ncbi:unnamed protein product [Rotaria sordida]|uniref:Uncharacterized protein n=1 Tax=Rotaria sordida TaxID=392033 RepID=A0A820FAB2_9BILA|nr:unnamed protein product [Rotaria sordida]